MLDEWFYGPFWAKLYLIQVSAVKITDMFYIKCQWYYKTAVVCFDFIFYLFSTTTKKYTYICLSQIIASNGSFDIVPTFVASGPHPAILDYIHRPRGEWPPQDQLQELQQLPMCLVLVGHKESQYYRQLARVSWSPGEIILISNLPTVIKQGFIVSKCTLKYFLKVYEDQNPTDSGRSKVGSYHLKTTFLHYLEKEPPKKITSPFVLMINLLHDLRKYVANAKLPHYFLPECNLLGSVGPIQRQIALKAIQTILADPAAAIIKCPSKPKEIYIDIPPDDLLAAFRGLFDDPNSIGCLEVLMMYMFRLDSWREARYRLQQERDVQENSRISNRPKLIKLSDMLGERIEQMWYIIHYGDVTWGSKRLKSLATALFVSSDRGLPLINGQ